MTLNNEISVGDVLTVIAILISFITLAFAWNNDRRLRRKEYSDRIRRAAGEIIVKLERWRELSLSYFDDIQPIIVDADVNISNGSDLISTRDAFWRDAIAMRASSLRRIIDEQVELAYSDLYGYDPRIQNLFISAVDNLRTIDKEMHRLFLLLVQRGMEKLENSIDEYQSAQLGNLLREISGKVAKEHRGMMERIISPFRIEMVKLIMSTDNDIVGKRVEISTPETLFSNIIYELVNIFLSLVKGDYTKNSDRAYFRCVEYNDDDGLIGAYF